MPRPSRSYVVVALFIALAAPLRAQLTVPAQPAEVMVLGTWHFENPGLDLVQTEIADVLAPEQQAELDRITAALARFRPTVVLVEAPPSSDAQLDSLYAAWRAGRHTMPRNEVQQLGFRLARHMDLAGVEPIDVPGEFPFGEMMQYAMEHDTAAAGEIQRLIAWIQGELARAHGELSMVEHLRWSNEPELIRQGHGFYVRFASVGAGDGWAGANVTSSWYERNIRIFGNIRRHAPEGARVLVIFGSGHAPILRELIGYDPTMRLVEANDWLPAE